MPSTNVIIGISGASMSGTSFSSVQQINFDPEEEFIKDASDDEITPSFSFTVRNGYRGRIDLRDPAQASAIANINDKTLVFSGINRATGGSNKSFTFANASTGQVGGSGGVGSKAGYYVNFTAGALTIA